MQLHRRHSVVALARFALLAASTGFYVGCGAGDLTINNPTSFVVVSGASTVRVGEQTTFDAIPYDAGGAVVPVDVTWSSSNPAVAVVSSSGSVMGVSTGTAIISAQADDATKTVGGLLITVTRGRITFIGVTPIASSLPVHGTVQLATLVKDVVGYVFTDRTLKWVSSNPTVATVSDQGLVTAIATGTASISVRTDDPNDTGVGTADITVTQSLLTSWKLDSVSGVNTAAWTDVGLGATLSGTLTFSPPQNVVEGAAGAVSATFAWTLTSTTSHELNFAFNAELDDRTVDLVNGTRLALAGNFSDANPTASAAATANGTWTIPASYHGFPTLRLCAQAYGAFGGTLVVTAYYSKVP